MAKKPVTEAAKKANRHQVIHRLVHENKIRTQQQLADLLSEAGFACTQTTVSRDIANLHLTKSKGKYYVFEEDLRLERLAAEMVYSVEDAGHIVVFKTRGGAAAGVAGALDEAHLEGALGTVAGDDTIMLVTKTPEAAQVIAKTIEGFID